ERYSGRGMQVQGLARVACIARRQGYPCYREIAAMAAAQRTLGTGNASPAMANLSEDFALARLVAFTDPALARHLTLAALNLGGGLGSLDSYNCRSAMAAAAEVDPMWAVELLKQLPPDDPKAKDQPRAQATAVVASRLVGSAQAREDRDLQENYQYNWLAAGEDDD
ncbi:MAG: hypothetical protein ABFE07_02720, partial [Armatimonadia bacterium]